MMRLAIEQSQSVPSAKYGVIHKEGCRDLRDGMPLGQANSFEEAAEIAEDSMCWDYDPEDWVYAPCVKF